MATFELIKELSSLERDQGLKRLLLAVYSANDGAGGKNRYIACSEQHKDVEGAWVSSRKGITIRRGELQQIVTALQSADFDAKPDTKNLSNKLYAEMLDWS